MNKCKVIVVDDEVNILKTIELSLTSQNFEVEVYQNAEEALKRIREVYFDLAFIDLKMHPLNGLQFLEKLKKSSPDTTAIIMTAYGSIDTAVEAIKKGAYDYITKPFTHKEFILIAERVYEYHKLTKEVLGLKTQIEDLINTGNIVTRNAEMLELLRISKDISNSEISILIEGESGTGKELLARFIHQNSLRSDRPFIPINCAAVPENLFESELFGHVKGAFTGAFKDKIGRVELANSGTLFLDEVTEIPKPMQVKLLRFLQNMEFERVGEGITRKINVRIISATNKDVKLDLNSGNIRDDFYYRISGFKLSIPPLRKRKDDIPLLLEHFLDKIAPETKFYVLPETLKILTDYNWPGNIREFENVVKRAVALSKDKIIKPSSLPEEIFNQQQKQFLSVIPSLKELEKKHIMEVIKIASNSKEAAKILGISETTLWRKRNEYNI
ncbi:sigma-54-dependent transcriptional regulator [Melioribacteraceae bacterium 4301-Me]|uniref:sigma-54-dependent transcriptional regulator n=1 Tax=Pyranulibacter aquaticus TaxID=3163344 RepID=UPI00359BC49D